MRPDLEKELKSKHWEIENRILGETQKVLGAGKYLGRAFDALGHKDRSKEHLKQEAMIAYAAIGIEPMKEELKNMSDQVKDSAGDLNRKLENPLVRNQYQVMRDSIRKIQK